MRFRIKRQFNYTDRAKIPRTGVKLRVVALKDAPPHVIVDDFGLSELKVGHDKEEWDHAQVVLEANRHTTSSFTRLVVGSVADVVGRAAPQLTAPLNDFDAPTNIIFTVKVVSRTGSRLLAEAKNVKAAEDDAQKDELLKVLAHDLGQEPWRLTWEEGTGPLIHVNRRILGHDNFLTRDPFMQGVVIPTALRMVLQRLARDRVLRMEMWSKPWLRFAAEYGPGEMPDEDDGGDAPDWTEVDHWVNQVLASYSENFQFANKINALLQSAPED